MRRKINIVLIVLFIIQGVASFSIGGSVYQISILKYLKYIIFGVFIVLNLNRNSVLKLPIVFVVVLLYMYFYSISHANSSLDFQSFSLRFMNLISPLFLIILPSGFLYKRDIEKVINLVTLSSCVFCFFEYMFLKDVFIDFNFSDNGGYYRCISFFIGPNNAAAIFCYLFIYYINLLRNGINILKVICIMLLLSSMVLTGSKTSILLLLGYIFSYSFFYIIKYKKIKSYFLKLFVCICVLFILSWSVYVFLVSYEVYSPREFHSIENDGRFFQILDFHKLINDNFIFPTYNFFPSPTYDNLYIQIWSDFGLIGLFIFVLGIGWTLLYYYSGISIAYAAFFVSWFLLGFTLNSLYAWPLSYIFYSILLRKVSNDN